MTVVVNDNYGTALLSNKQTTTIATRVSHRDRVVEAADETLEFFIEDSLSCLSDYGNFCIALSWELVILRDVKMNTVWIDLTRIAGEPDFLPQGVIYFPP